MTAMDDTFGGGGLEAQIDQWRGYVARHRAISTADVDELEDHLREQVARLEEAGLDGDEAFLVAVRRMGGLDAVSAEFAREHSERLWKQLVLSPTPEGADGDTAPRRELGVVLGLAAAAGATVQVPGLFGIEDDGFYARNVTLLVLPFLAAYFAWKRRVDRPVVLALLAAPFALAAVLVNAYPFTGEAGGSVDSGDSVTEILTAIHLPVVLWLAVGLAYVGGEWGSHRRRMDFIRFTGEWVVYLTLLALGGGVLVGLTTAGFDALDVDVSGVVGRWVVPSAAAGGLVVAAWLVEAKQAVVENIAPVLTRVFTPLTTLMLLAFLVAIPASGALVDVDRDLLILVDVILVLVLGLLLYAISARDAVARPDFFDRLQLLLVGSALAVDLLMLSAIAGRIAEFGLSPNKAAGLGLNLVLLVNLAWAAWLGLRFVRRQLPFSELERWQTTYVPVYGGWAALVVVTFPLVFGFG